MWVGSTKRYWVILAKRRSPHTECFAEVPAYVGRKRFLELVHGVEVETRRIDQITINVDARKFKAGWRCR